MLIFPSIFYLILKSFLEFKIKLNWWYWPAIFTSFPSSPHPPLWDLKNSSGTSRANAKLSHFKLFCVLDKWDKSVSSKHQNNKSKSFLQFFFFLSIKLIINLIAWSNRSSLHLKNFTFVNFFPLGDGTSSAFNWNVFTCGTFVVLCQLTRAV